MRRARRGFMLAEVLVAVAIMAMGISVLLGAIINSSNLNRDTRFRNTAIFLAQRQMWDLEERTHLTEPGRMISSEDGEFDSEEFSRFRWDSEIEENEDTASYELVVTVYWKLREGDSKERSVSIQSQSLMPRKTVDAP